MTWLVEEKGSSVLQSSGQVLSIVEHENVFNDGQRIGEEEEK